MIEIQGYAPCCEHSNHSLSNTVQNSIKRSAKSLARDVQLNRWSDLLSFSAFLEDMEGLGIQRGLHNTPGSYEALEKANLLLSAAMAECLDQLAQLEAVQ